MMARWIEPNIRLRWWNPLTWLTWLLSHHRWYVMQDAYGGRHCYCIAVCSSKREARKLAEAAKDQE